jgi:hypothetical protein
MTVLRDVLYAFQGINGNYVKYNPKLNAYAIDPNVIGHNLLIY